MFESQIILTYLRTCGEPKCPNLKDNIGLGQICLKEENLSFNNKYIIILETVNCKQIYLRNHVSAKWRMISSLINIIQFHSMRYFFYKNEPLPALVPS